MKDEMSKMDKTIKSFIRSRGISKNQMDLTIKILERRAANLGDDVARFRGIPASEFDKEHLLMICNLFANEWKISEAKYLQATDRIFPSFIKGASATCDVLCKPTLRRKIWNRIKSLA